MKKRTKKTKTKRSASLLRELKYQRAVSATRLKRDIEKAILGVYPRETPFLSAVTSAEKLTGDVVEVQQPYVDPLQNPKDRIGVTKVPLWLVPSSSVIHQAMAMADGARKYGAYNWREKRVITSIYLSAALRHIYKYLDGSQLDEESGQHELGHALACLGIILDAEETGNLQDDRPKAAPTAALLSRLKK